KWTGKSQISPPWSRKSLPANSPLVATGRASDDWFALARVVKLDCIDWSNVDIEEEREFGVPMVSPREAGVVRPPGGFPPVFGIKNALCSTHWVSGEVKLALVAAGARGIDFGRAVPVREKPTGKFAHGCVSVEDF